MPGAESAVAVRFRKGGSAVCRALALGLILCVSRLPAQVAQGPVHEVKDGETLWGLAVRYLDSGERWREIFDLNRQLITDPDRLWPGQSIRLPAAASQAVAIAAAAAAEPGSAVRETPPPPPQADPFGGPSLFDRSPERVVTLGGFEVEAAADAPLVSPSDFDRAPFLATPEELEPIGTSARELVANPLRLKLPATVALNHRVVLAAAGLSLQVGDELLAFKWGRRIGRHGHIVEPSAVLKVLAVEGDSARAVVDRIFGAYEVGDPVIRSLAYPTQPPVAVVPVEAGVMGRILAFATKQPLLGLSEVAFVDLGTTQGVELGDEFAAFAAAVSDPLSASLDVAQAVLRVVQVRAASSTAVVVRMRDVGTTEGAPVRLVGEAAPAAP